MKTKKFPGPVDPEKAPDWLRPGSSVVHSTFGKGVIKCYRIIKNGPAMEIEFAGGRKILNPEYGIPHLRPATDDVSGRHISWFQKLFERK